MDDNPSRDSKPRRLLFSLFVVVLGWCGLAHVTGAETNATLEAAPPRPTTNSIADAELQLRRYLKLQEQLHATLLAVEQARVESSQELRTNAQVLSSRLEFLESALAAQREQNLRATQESNRTMLLMAGSIVGLGLLALAFTAMFQSRGMNRLADIATGLSTERAMLAGVLPAHTSAHEPLLIGPGPVHATNQAMLATIDRLERRIRELEDSAQPMLPFTDTLPANGDGKSAAARNGAEHRTVDHVSVLLGKGQVLLSLGQADAALACFDEAVQVAPNHADAHMKRGQALERLKRPDDAIACYDRAITLNRSLTQAYLSKGAVFNRQERYAEALACYEQALRSETKA
jgi:tetratricopeptide (TPR) repeat protein